MITFVTIVVLGKNLQSHPAVPEASGELIFDTGQVARDQREQVARFRVGILPAHPVSRFALDTEAYRAIAVRQQSTGTTGAVGVDLGR